MSWIIVSAVVQAGAGDCRCGHAVGSLIAVSVLCTYGSTETAAQHVVGAKQPFLRDRPRTGTSSKRLGERAISGLAWAVALWLGLARLRSR